MLKLNQECKKKLEISLKSKLGKSLIEDFKKIIVNEDNLPANANDGFLYALQLSRTEGQLDVIKQLIKIGEKNG